MEKSLKQIIYETSVLADAHVQLRSFYYGDLLDIIKIGAIDYATCFLSINSASNNANFETFNLELFVFDILSSDDSNRTDIENTTKRILNDLITVIRYSTRWNNFSEVLSDVSELKYYDKLQDRLSGWGCTIQLKVYSNDCLVGLPIDDYDFDMAGNFELTVLAIVKNTDNDILATKLVSDSDDTIIIPDIKVTDSDGKIYEQPAGTNVVCTAGGGSGDVNVNGVNVGTYTAPNTFELDVINNGSNQIGSLVGNDWVIDNTEVFINKTQVGDIVAEDELIINVTLNGSNSGSWNSGTQTWEVVSDPCEDVTYEIVDIDENILYSGSIASGGNLDQKIQNSTVTITDDDANTLYTVSTLAEGSDTQVIQDSEAVLKNTDNTILSTTSINAEASEDIIAPDAIFSINGTQVASIPSGDSDSIQVRKESGSDQIGSLQGQYWRIDDSVITLKDSSNNTLSTTNVPATESQDIIAPDSTIENSDASYTDTIESGGTLVLPDTTINITDQFGNPLDTITFPVYSTVNIDIDSYIPPCLDATYDLEDSLGNPLSSGSIPSGTNDVIVAPDATVENSDASYTDTVVSGGTLVLADSDVNVNGNLEGTVVSVQTIDIDVTDGVNPVTPTSIGIVGNTVTIEVPTATAPVGATLMKTGQTTSYRTGDDGDFEAGRATDFFTLASNNAFGNTNRFTDELGGSTYANTIVIDWSTYDGSTVLGWSKTLRGGTVRDIAQNIGDALLLSIGGFTTGWRIPNVIEQISIFNYSLPGSAVNYSPFNVLVSYLETSTGASASSQFVYIASQGRLVTLSTSSQYIQYLACRTFTVTGTTLT